MDKITLAPIPVTLDCQQLMEANHIPADSDLAEEFTDLVAAAQSCLACKAILVPVSAELPFPLPAGISPAYVYAMTVGREIEENEDCDYPYLGDVVRQAALDQALAYTMDYLAGQNGGRRFSFTNPGTESGWETVNNVAIAQWLSCAEIGITTDSRGNLTPWYSTLGLFY